MGLNGQLRDLSVLDILQIVAFSKKTGYLRIDSPRGRAAVVFKEGLVVCAYSWSTLEEMRRLAKADLGGVREALVQDQIEIALRELARLREGSFSFHVTSSTVTELEGLNITPFLLFEGINPQHLLLDLAKALDEAQGQRPVAKVESNPVPVKAPPRPNRVPPSPAAATPQGPNGGSDNAGAGATIVLVDDEADVAEVLAAELRNRGHRVVTAGGPTEGAEVVRKLASAAPLVLITDMGMPTSTGKSFQGGFELVRLLRKAKLRVPVLLMAERMSEMARAKARELGVTKVALKPTLSKLDPEQYASDLRSFGARLLPKIAALVEGKDKKKSAPLLDDESPAVLDYLSSMSEQLTNPSGPVDISATVLEGAARFLERGILFLLKDDVASALHGFGPGAPGAPGGSGPEPLVVELKQVEPFAQVVRDRTALRLSEPFESLETPLYRRIGRGSAGECLLVPLINNRRVLAILFGDNASSGRPLGKLRALELFIAQAGMALENAFLHRKLKQFESARPAAAAAKP
jgi:CheY-like chemotaxis protein